MYFRNLFCGQNRRQENSWICSYKAPVAAWCLVEFDIRVRGMSFVRIGLDIVICWIAAHVHNMARFNLCESFSLFWAVFYWAGTVCEYNYAAISIQCQISSTLAPYFEDCEIPLCSELPLCNSQMDDFEGVIAATREGVALVSSLYCVWVHSRLPLSQLIIYSS